MNHPAYKALRQAALDSGYSKTQAQELTRDQIASATGIDVSRMTDAEVANMQSKVAAEMQQRDNEVDREFVVDQLTGNKRVAFGSRFDKADIEFRHIEGARAVIVWLDGPPPKYDDEGNPL